MPSVEELRETRQGRRFLNKEVARRSICPYCGTSGVAMPDFRMHIKRHVLRRENQNPEYM